MGDRVIKHYARIIRDESVGRLQEIIGEHILGEGLYMLKAFGRHAASEHRMKFYINEYIVGKSAVEFLKGPRKFALLGFLVHLAHDASPGRKISVHALSFHREPLAHLFPDLIREKDLIARITGHRHPAGTEILYHVIAEQNLARMFVREKHQIGREKIPLRVADREALAFYALAESL